jgi:hypothetical protein
MVRRNMTGAGTVVDTHRLANTLHLSALQESIAPVHTKLANFFIV